jgi:galactokinase
VSIDLTRARVEYRAQFARAAEVITRAPGRVNIIGEHTDYNHGFVLPMAIEHETAILACPRADLTLHAYAANLKRTAEADLTRCARDPREGWMDYVVGVAHELAKLGKPLRGADLMIIGDVPIGCGLGSSASLEMAALCLFEALGGFEVEGAEAPRLGQRVENLFLGLSTGIMDQFISRMGKRGHALFLDCRSFDYELIPVAFPGAKFVIANTCLARGLTSSKYNERVAECKQAVQGMRDALGKEGTHLRDFTMDDLLATRARLSDVAFRRARHVISEDVRTKAACEAMRAGDPAALGRLMNGSDASLRDDYEVTCPELDAMTEIARALPGCHGARMTGAGFGGCTINLVQSEAVPSFTEKLMAEYTRRTGITGQVFISLPSDGAARVE